MFRQFSNLKLNRSLSIIALDEEIKKNLTGMDERMKEIKKRQTVVFSPEMLLKKIRAEFDGSIK